MYTSAFFLSIILLSEASAAGPLRRRERTHAEQPCCLCRFRRGQPQCDVISTRDVIYPCSFVVVFSRGSCRVVVVARVDIDAVPHSGFHRRYFFIYIVSG
ncbi:hypothetical protein PG985_006362 [Apiospora marii]|uniref:Secreted protein n=1 Tax=Apiospora marii TaxID=335849 RepID=A0ABR1S7L2_9PEZI